MDKRTMLLALVKEYLQTGRYAVNLTEGGDDFYFYRLAKPTSGKYKGWTLLQRQSSESWWISHAWAPDGELKLNYHPAPLIVLEALVASPKEAAYAYAEKLGRCARCGVSLTDEESRTNMVGPECVKHWPWMPELAREKREKANAS